LEKLSNLPPCYLLKSAPQQPKNEQSRPSNVLSKTTTMKNLFYTLFFCLTLSIGSQAQIKLIGATYNTAAGTIDLLRWAAFDATSVTATPTILDAYLFTSSSFDPYNSNYYISGVSGDSTGLYSYNVDTEESNLTTGSLYNNVAEFDMSNSKMYNLRMDTEAYISIYEYDINSNQDSLIGTIYEPGTIGIIADAIGFDSNNGILYYVGYTNDPALALYAIPVRESSFSYTRTILNTSNPNSNISSLNYDNANDKLFAANDSYDQNGNYNGRDIVEIDITTGDVNVRGELNDFPYFVGGSSLFDQNSGTFLLVGITTNGALEMIAFDTFTNTYVTGFVPDNVSEIACDNSQFAAARYSITGIDSPSALNFSLYPNPASDVLNIEWSSKGPAQMQIFTAMGELVYQKNITSANRMNVDMSTFASGLYVVNLMSAEQTVSEKILVK
jgi:hypothetical protein